MINKQKRFYLFILRTKIYLMAHVRWFKKAPYSVAANTIALNKSMWFYGLHTLQLRQTHLIISFTQQV